MIFRRFSLIVSKYLAISLCFITVLLTTPWGTQLTLGLLNNIEGVNFDYHSGALVRNIRLNAANLNLDNVEINVTDLSTELDFSCTWKKRLCINFAKAEKFSLRLQASKPVDETQVIKNPSTYLFEMPFSIEADSIEIEKSHLFVENTEITIERFSTQLSINKSEFALSTAKAQQLLVSLKQSEQAQQTAEKLVTKDKEVPLALPDINLPIALVIKQLNVDDINVVIRGYQDKQSAHCEVNCQQWQSSNNQLSGSWVNSAVNISQFSTSTPTFSINSLVGKAKLTSPYQLNGKVNSEIHSVHWWPELANTKQEFSVQGALNNLHVDLRSQGNLALKAQGHINLLDKALPFDLKLDADKISLPESLVQYGQYSALALDISGDLTQQAVKLSSQMKGYGYEDAQVKLTAKQRNSRFSIEEFSFTDSKTRSQLDFHGDIALLANDISWQITANSTGFELPRISMTLLSELLDQTEELEGLTTNITPESNGRLKGSINSKGTLTDNTWSVLLNKSDVSGHINHIEFSIKADIGINQLGSFKPGHLLINFNESALTLHAFENSFWDLKGQLSVDNIHNWHHELNGSFISNFTISGKQNNPVIRANTTFSELNWQRWRSNLLSLDVNYQPMQDHKIQLTLNNDQLHWDNTEKHYSVDNLLFSIDGQANNHKISAQWLGELAGEIILTGQFNNSFSQWQSTIEKSVLSHQSITLENDRPFAVDFDLSRQDITLSPHCWQDKGLGLCLPKQATLGKKGDLGLELAIDFAVIDQLFLPKDSELVSQVNGEIKLNWSSQQSITTQALLSLSPGYLTVSDELNEHKLSQWSDGYFSLVLDDKQLISKLFLNDINKIPLVQINAKLQFNNDTVLNQSTINSSVLLNELNLQPLQHIIPNVISLEGKVSADLTVNGTIEAPIFNGDLSLVKGKLRVRKNANTLDDISSAIAINDNQATVTGRFFIDDNAADLQGELSWQDSLAMNLDLTAEHLPLVFPPNLMMSIAPALNIKLAEKSLIISGNIDVLAGKYNIEKLTGSIVSVSDDVILVDQNGEVIIKETSGFDIKTNIKVNIDKAFEISGQGLHSNLFGQLQISQQDNHPLQMFGRIQSSDGTFQAYGQKLQIEKGELTFNGPIDNPYFNLRASRHIKAEDIDVGMKITGLADALEFTLFSTPTMEMPEMLSYLVRGRSLDAGTENSTLAASFLVGFGATNSVGLFDRIEEIPLISNIAVDTEGEGDKTQATVSGYLGNRVYLKYGIGVYEPINELTVRMFILNRFWLEIVSGIEQSTDLYYSFYID